MPAPGNATARRRRSEDTTRALGRLRELTKRLGLSVLVIDPNEDAENSVSAIVDKTLRLLNPNVIVRQVDTAEEALGDLSKGFRPDVILTNYQLPGMDGATFQEVLTARRMDFPVVVIAADPLGVRAAYPELLVLDEAMFHSSEQTHDAMECLSQEDDYVIDPDESLHGTCMGYQTNLAAKTRRATERLQELQEQSRSKELQAKRAVGKKK